MTTPLDPTSSDRPPSERASLARLIVCEREGEWAVGLRRELPAPGVRAYEARSLPECWEMLARWPASLLVVELTRWNARALIERMASLGREYPLARIAVVAERNLASCEWLVREAGAVHFLVSPRRLGPLARLAVRHLDAAPRPERTLTERIWDHLPWGAGQDEWGIDG